MSEAPILKSNADIVWVTFAAAIVAAVLMVCGIVANTRYPDGIRGRSGDVAGRR